MIIFIILLVCFGAQIFPGYLCRSTNSLSIQYIITNISTAVDEFRNQLLLSTPNYDCNLFMTNDFNQDVGSFQVECWNQIQNYRDSLQFDMIITQQNGKISYISRAYFVCSFRNLCSRSIIGDWIQWQIVTIHETISAEQQVLSHLKQFQIYGLFYNDKIQLCIHRIIDLNTFDNKTDECNTYNYSNISMKEELSSRIKNMNNFGDTSNGEKIVVNTNSIDDFTSETVDANQLIIEKLTTSTFNERTKSSLIIFGIIVLLVILVILIPCLICCHRNRRGYDLAAPS